MSPGATINTLLDLIARVEMIESPTCFDLSETYLFVNPYAWYDGAKHFNEIDYEGTEILNKEW